MDVFQDGIIYYENLMEGKDIFKTNVYDFINSSAIARHCREIGHQFTPLQSAYLIHGSRRHTLAEKHEAFQWLIDNMPDGLLEEEKGQDDL